MYNIDNFLDGVKIAMPRIMINKTSEQVIFSWETIQSEGVAENFEVIGEISLAELQEVCDGFDSSVEFIEQGLFSRRKYEIPVKILSASRNMPFRTPEREHYLSDDHNHEFQISKASMDFVFALMCSISQQGISNIELPPLLRYRRLREAIQTFDDFCEALRIITAKVVSPFEYSIHEFRKMLHAYLFNISFGNNIVFALSDLKDERAPMRRRMSRRGRYFPYMTYNPELVIYYHQGLSADIPFTQFLAFYHVAEFFFHSISEQDAFEEIESMITRPSFSPHRKEDLRQFYNNIKKRMRVQRDDGVWDERSGLLLCLKKFIPDLAVLKNNINSLDSSAVDYYSNNKVSFADESVEINFNESSETVYTKIRNRVYAVRNAIVHSKDGEKLRYEPFKHDKELSKEIYLIRSIAEEIIINSAKNSGIKIPE